MGESDKVLEVLEDFIIKKFESFNKNTSAEEIQVVTDLVRAATVRKEINKKTNLLGG